MRYGYREYSNIKRLIDKFNINFKDYREYECFMMDLARILKV